MGSKIVRGLLVVVVLAITANADVIVSQTGNFSQDDDQQIFNFSLSASSDVTFQALSFAGGTNANGQAIAEGGFAPVLTLFDSTGSELGYDAGGIAPGGCGLRNIDSATGFCLDAYMNLNLGAGGYFLVLTEYDNFAIGPNYSDGFFYDGSGNFTDIGTGPFYLNAGSGYQRTSAWAVDITAPSMSPVPEPSSLRLLLPALVIGCIAVAVQKQRS